MLDDVSIMDVLNQYDPEIWLGVVIAIAVFVVELILCTKGVIFAKTDKMIEEAKKTGRVLYGKRVRYTRSLKKSDDKLSRFYYTAEYEYEYEGKTKKKRLVLNVTPPYSLAIFYDAKGKKFLTNYENKGNPFMIVIYIIPFVVSYLVLRAIGYHF